jgi:hypothetical protein
MKPSLSIKALPGVFEETCERPQVNGDADIAEAEKVAEDGHVIV